MLTVESIIAVAVGAIAISQISLMFIVSQQTKKLNQLTKFVIDRELNKLAENLASLFDKPLSEKQDTDEKVSKKK